MSEATEECVPSWDFGSAITPGLQKCEVGSFKNVRMVFESEVML